MPAIFKERLFITASRSRCIRANAASRVSPELQELHDEFTTGQLILLTLWLASSDSPRSDGGSERSVPFGGFNHSINYRSVVILGTADKVVGAEKLRALEVISEHIIPGRWADVRPPNDKEMKATTVLEIPIKEASAKIRTGPPMDDVADMDMTCWAGELPFDTMMRAPVPDPRLAPGVPIPAYLANYRRPDLRVSALAEPVHTGATEE
jgi:hypothetical protein